MKLYEIDNEILKCVDPETGEILDEEKLNQLEMERDKKIEGVILWYKSVKAEKEAVRAEGAALYKRAKTLENLEERLKKYVEYALGGEKFKTNRCSVSYRKSTRIVIDDVKAIPKKFLNELKEDWFSKTAIKAAIEKGKAVKGAHQEDRNGIVIS